MTDSSIIIQLQQNKWPEIIFTVTEWAVMYTVTPTMHLYQKIADQAFLTWILQSI